MLTINLSFCYHYFLDNLTILYDYIYTISVLKIFAGILRPYDVIRSVTLCGAFYAGMRTCCVVSGDGENRLILPGIQRRLQTAGDSEFLLPPIYSLCSLCNFTCTLTITPYPTCPAPRSAQKSCS